MYRPMRKVLFISQYLYRNGTEAFMMNVFRGIDHHRFQIDFLLYSWEETDYSREVEQAGGMVYRVPCRKESPWKWHQSLCSFFRQHAKEYSAIHFCGNSLTAIAPIYYAYKYGVPVRIVHAHNSSARGWHNKFLHCMKRDYVYHISTHHFACSTLAAQWFFGKKQSTIIRNGIDVKKFTFNKSIREQYREDLGVKANDVVVGHVGRFVEEKNHLFMVDVFAQFIQRCPDAKLMLIGVGSLMDKIKVKAEQLELSDKILFMGERSDVNHLMQAMDVFLMPSLFEGFPFVLVEAQAAGLPCLISDTINKDICITSNISFASLEETPKEWAEKLFERCNAFVRTDCSESIVDSGYSIEDTILFLQKVYTTN